MHLVRRLPGDTRQQLAPGTTAAVAHQPYMHLDNGATAVVNGGDRARQNIADAEPCGRLDRKRNVTRMRMHLRTQRVSTPAQPVRRRRIRKWSGSSACPDGQWLLDQRAAFKARPVKQIAIEDFGAGAGNGAPRSSPPLSSASRDTSPIEWLT